MITKTEKTFWVRIYASGPIETAKTVCRQYCLGVGLCVTVEPSLFIYTGGEESGYCVGLIQYPRFPTREYVIIAKAKELATRLLDETSQHSILIMTPSKTVWMTKRTSP